MVFDDRRRLNPPVWHANPDCEARKISLPSILSACVGGLLAAIFFTVSGWSLARVVLPGPLALGVAPVFGWAVFSVLSLAFVSFFGFTPHFAIEFSICFLALGLVPLKLPNHATQEWSLPWWSFVVAAAQALLPAMAIIPKYVAGGVLLGPQMYDHAKVAIIDQIMRQGMPPQNPFFGATGARSDLAYYYLWHFSAALLGSVLHVTGWTADIAMTWFTAFSSALLMMALAMYLTRNTRAIWLVAALGIPASLRPILGLFLPHNGKALINPDSDIGAWINQASWVPQHVAAGCCAVLSALLIAKIARNGNWATAVALALTVAAGFESSTWVGGVAFAAAALAAAPLLLLDMTAAERRRFIGLNGVAVLLAGIIIAPFCLQQVADLSSKAVGIPMAFGPYRALGASFQGVFKSIADFLIFWPLILPFNFPAIIPVGALGCAYALKNQKNLRRDPIVLVLTCFAVACLCVTWLARSTIDNNDLGWRAVIPSLLILTAFAAAAWSKWLSSANIAAVTAALMLAALGLPQEIIGFHQNFAGQQPADAAGFARSIVLWQDVRKFTAPSERVGNNPAMLSNLTPWPDNISWALLSDRPSCYAGWSTAIAYSDVPRQRLRRIDTMFQRVFAGHAQAGDVENLAVIFHCHTIVVTSKDGAWSHDPFAASPEYKLVEQQGEEWKLYQIRSFTNEAN